MMMSGYHVVCLSFLFSSFVYSQQNERSYRNFEETDSDESKYKWKSDQCDREGDHSAVEVGQEHTIYPIFNISVTFLWVYVYLLSWKKLFKNYLNYSFTANLNPSENF